MDGDVEVTNRQIIQINQRLIEAMAAVDEVIMITDGLSRRLVEIQRMLTAAIPSGLLLDAIDREVGANDPDEGFREG